MTITDQPPTRRSKGISYQQLLDTDTHPVPSVLREENPISVGPVRVPVERYTSRAWFDLEVERLWKRVWQMACREEHIPHVGDHIVYEIVDLSFIVVRVSPTQIKAFWNSCLHRGRLLRDRGAPQAAEFRCPFHGFCWNIDGSLKQIPCEWDFPHIDKDNFNLP